MSPQTALDPTQCWTLVLSPIFIFFAVGYLGADLPVESLIHQIYTAMFQVSSL